MNINTNITTIDMNNNTNDSFELTQMPEQIFIIPYRNRKAHMLQYIPHMRRIVAGESLNAIFLFIHQCDEELFNRGAMINIGILEAKKINPNALFIIQDIDILPKYPYSFHWEPTIPNSICHVIGEKDINLGGIISFNGYQIFEKTEGFPNYYGWGPEDWTLRQRCEAKKILIDESNQVNHKNPELSIMLPHPKANSSPIIRKNLDQYYESFEKEKSGEIIIDGFANVIYDGEYEEIEPNFYMYNVKFSLKQDLYTFRHDNQRTLS